MPHLLHILADGFFSGLAIVIAVYAYGWAVIIWSERPMVVRDIDGRWRAQRSIAPIPPSRFQPPPTRLIKPRNPFR